MLAQVKRYPQIEMLELGTGCWPGSAHMDLDSLRTDAGKRRDYLAKLTGQGLEISALSCHGNPVHPAEETASYPGTRGGDSSLSCERCDNRRGGRNRNGVLDTKSYRQMVERSWTFRSVGWGHDELEWKRIVSAVRLAGYDGVLSIEHEDALASTHEGLSTAVEMLSRVLLRQPPVKASWA